MITYVDEVFAPIDRDLELARIAGGNETEVYRTDDHQYVVKLKSELGGTRAGALAHARSMRAAADRYAECLGQRHTIASHYLVSRDSAGQVQVLVLQPYLHEAQTLFGLDYGALEPAERAAIATELREIIRRSLGFYRSTGSMPDLYGRSSASAAARAHDKTLARLPHRLWSFLVRRNLLRSHNLMLVGGVDPRVVLVDYDFVRRGWLYRLIYFAVRWMLFWRDHMLIMLMRRGGLVPGKEQAGSSER